MWWSLFCKKDFLLSVIDPQRLTFPAERGSARDIYIRMIFIYVNYTHIYIYIYIYSRVA